MSLAFLCHPYHRGGVTRWMVDAATEWARRDLPCWFITPTPTRPFLSGRGRPAMVELLHSSGSAVRTHAPGAGSTFELGTNRARAYWYASRVVEALPSGVPIILSDDAAVWQAASWIAGRNPAIGVLHADDPVYYELARQYGSTLPLVAVSKRIAARARAEGGTASATIPVIPCGIPMTGVARDGSATDALRILWIGRIDEEQKRASDIARVAALLRDRSLPFSLTVIGDGPARAGVERSIQDEGLASIVRLTGWVSSERVAELSGSADVLLSTSNFEGMPLAIMEAMRAGCGVVASRVSGVEDCATLPGADRCIWVYEVGDVQAAARALECVAALPRATVATAARAFAEREFSIARCMDRYAAVITELPAVRGSRPRLWPQRLASAHAPLLAAARRARARFA